MIRLNVAFCLLHGYKPQPAYARLVDEFAIRSGTKFGNFDDLFLESLPFITASSLIYSIAPRLPLDLLSMPNR
jgi:hypothetical protein